MYIMCDHCSLVTILCRFWLTTLLKFIQQKKKNLKKYTTSSVRTKKKLNVSHV